MQIVIDIDEDLYKSIIAHRCKTRFQQRCDYEDLKNAIEDGVPLPKGHGDLIDKSDLLTTTDIRADGSEFTYVPYNEIDNATIVVEADKESEDKDDRL